MKISTARSWAGSKIVTKVTKGRPTNIIEPSPVRWRADWPSQRPVDVYMELSTSCCIFIYSLVHLREVLQRIHRAGLARKCQFASWCSAMVFVVVRPETPDHEERSPYISWTLRQLVRKNRPNKVQWSTECQEAYVEVMNAVIQTAGRLTAWLSNRSKRGPNYRASAKREKLNPRKARKIWGYAHFRCNKTSPS